MIFDPISILRARFTERRAARVLAARWSAAAARDPELREDIIRLGGLLAQPETRFENGIEMRDPIDPYRLARDEGRRTMALDLLALMNVTPHQLSQMSEVKDAY